MILTAQKMKFLIKNFFSKCDQIGRFSRFLNCVWSFFSIMHEKVKRLWIQALNNSVNFRKSTLWIKAVVCQSGYPVNPLNGNPTKLFECVWPFCGVGTSRVKWIITQIKHDSEIYHKHPCKHTTCIPSWNDVEPVVSTSFQRGIHVVCLQGCRKR